MEYDFITIGSLEINKNCKINYIKDLHLKINERCVNYRKF